MTEAAAPVVRTTKCPSCGAGVPLHTRAAVQAVCPYCRSTLVRTDLHWEDVGKMAALADDLSPVRLGMRGHYRNHGFTVIGRLQKQYADGVWNEWLLMLDNNQRAWLGEGSGLYSWTEATTLIEPLPPFSSLEPGKLVRINNREWTITDIEQASCIACEGELPFRIPPGASAGAADAQGPDGEFATLDYSDYPPAFYTGRVVTLGELNLIGADAAAPAPRPATELRCGGCGGCMTRLLPDSLAITCANCGTVHNQTPRGKLLVAWRQAQQSMRPVLMPGTRGTLQGTDFEVVGWQQRRSDVDSWDEFLLYNPKTGIRWLVAADGHWTLLQPVAGVREQDGISAEKDGFGYKHFATYTATTTTVLGEFNWRLRKKESWLVSDYILPPRILCRERSSREITWSLGHYLPHAEVVAGFGLDRIAAPRGIAPCQPGPRVLPLLFTFMLTMFAAHLLETQLRSSQHVQRERIGSLVLNSGVTSAALVSEPFELKARSSVLRVLTSSNVSNHWIGYDYTLVPQDGGEPRELYRELAYYWGNDGYENWSEGSSYDRAALAAVPAGRYVLQVEANTERWNWRGDLHGDIVTEVNIEHGGETGNWWRLFGLLCIGPLAGLLWKFHFESSRWKNSDHPWSSAE